MLDTQEGFKEVFKFQMGWKEFLMEFQPLFKEDISFLDEEGTRVVSLKPVFSLIERMALKRGFTVDLDNNSFNWEQDWIYIYVEES